MWSIIIPALNEASNLPNCLDALINLEYRRDGFEIVLVDNGSTDETVAVAQSYSDRINLRVIVVPKVSIAALRNAGAADSTGSAFAFLDGDCVVEPCWLTLADHFLREHPGCVFGASYRVPSNAGWPARLWYRYFTKDKNGEVPYVPASNLLIERKTFLEAGGFNETLASNEDSHICAKVKLRGARVLAFPKLSVTHLGAENNLTQFVRRQFWHGSDVLHSVAAVNNGRAIALAVYTLACMIWFTAGAALGHLSFWPALSALSVAAGLTIRAYLRQGRFVDIPGVFTLVIAYSVARALALPFAVLNLAVRRSSRKQDLQYQSSASSK